MTPPRLLHTTRSSFERDLLRAAASDHAPEATRERVRQSVARALAGAEVRDTALGTGWPAEPRHHTRLDHARVDHARVDHARVDHARVDGRRATGVGKTWAALGLGLLGLAACVALVIRGAAPEQRLATAGKDASVEPPPTRSAPSRGAPRGVSTARLDQVGAPGRADHSEEAQRPLANTSAVAPQVQSAGPPPRALGDDDAPDWLGAQLQLLGEARRQLADGSLEQAHGSLDSYDRRFPDGVLGPQIVALRAELRQRQAARARRRSGTQLNLSSP